MASFVKVTGLSGCHDESPLCYLLEIDDAKILLDCGWNEALDIADLKPLASVAKQIDAVLLSHADLDHLGAFPYAAVHLGLTCPVYCTTPVHDMGQNLMLDLVSAKRQQTETVLFTSDDVETAFSQVTMLRYSQPFGLPGGKSHGIVVSAYTAGHTVGGTIWKVRKYSEEIIYAVDFNHRKERHLNGTVLLNTETLMRPSLLITDAFNASIADPLPRKQRDAVLVDTLLATLRSGGNVLIPTDTSTRVLELAYLLDQNWLHQKRTQPLVFLSPCGHNTTNLAKSMIEWMGDGVSQNMHNSTGIITTPFDFRHLRVITDPNDLDAIPGPKVVLTPFPGLSCGGSSDLLRQWCSNPNNLVLLPDRAQLGSLARRLYDEWCLKAQWNQPTPISLDLSLPYRLQLRVALEGQELLDYNMEKQRVREIEAEMQQAKDNDDSRSDIDDEDDDDDGNEKQVAFVYDTWVKDAHRSTGFFKQANAFKMFPVHETRHKVDEYGEVLDMTVFSRFETQHQHVPDDFIPVENSSAAVPIQQKETIAKQNKKELQDVPSKYIEMDAVLNLKCRLLYIDFEGRSDGRSVKNIISQMAPRKLMLVHGTYEATQSLASFCQQSELLTDQVYWPALGECVNVSSATNLYQVILTDSLVNALKFSRLDEHQLCHVSGVIRTQMTAAGSRQMLEVLPVHEQTSRRPVIVGELRLSELRKQLHNQGYSTYFASGGVLVVNGAMVIRKLERSFVVEGQISPDYYKVRSLIYNLQALI